MLFNLILATGTPTSTSHEAVLPFTLLAITTALPSFNPVIFPVLSTFATVASEVVQTSSWSVALSGFTVAFICEVEPASETAEICYNKYIKLIKEKTGQTITHEELEKHDFSSFDEYAENNRKNIHNKFSEIPFSITLKIHWKRISMNRRTFIKSSICLGCAGALGIAAYKMMNTDFKILPMDC